MFTLRAVLPCSRTLVGLRHAGLSTAAVVHRKRSALDILKTTTRIAPQGICAEQQQPKHRWHSSAATSKTSTDRDQELGRRIYYGTLAPRMKAVKVFSLTTSLAGLAAQPVLMEHGMKLGGTAMAVLLCSFAGFFTFVTPFLLHFITKKYVTEIHYNAANDEYTATTISLILQKVQTKFRPDDVTVPDVPGMFTSFVVKKKPLFVDPALFDNPEHYVRMMGYDKPVDFKLETTDSAAASTKQSKN